MKQMWRDNRFENKCKELASNINITSLKNTKANTIKKKKDLLRRHTAAGSPQPLLHVHMSVERLQRTFLPRHLPFRQLPPSLPAGIDK